MRDVATACYDARFVKGEIDKLPPAPRRGKEAVAVAQKKKGRPQSE